MSCKSAMYAANASAQEVANGGIINFGAVVRRFGGNCTISGGNVNINGTGYYDMDADVTFTAGGAGTAVISLYKDGVAIPGASASLTAVADSIYSVSVPAIVRQVCCCESVVTAVLSGISGTVTNAAVAIEKI